MCALGVQRGRGRGTGWGGGVKVGDAVVDGGEGGREVAVELKQHLHPQAFILSQTSINLLLAQ